MLVFDHNPIKHVTGIPSYWGRVAPLLWTSVMIAYEWCIFQVILVMRG